MSVSRLTLELSRRGSTAPSFKFSMTDSLIPVGLSDLLDGAAIKFDVTYRFPLLLSALRCNVTSHSFAAILNFKKEAQLTQLRDNYSRTRPKLSSLLSHQPAVRSAIVSTHYRIASAKLYKSVRSIGPVSEINQAATMIC
jgi:hypothetical protein